MVDGVISTGGMTIESDDLVVGVGAPLGDGRVVTAVVSRALVDLITLEFVADGPDGPDGPTAPPAPPAA